MLSVSNERIHKIIFWCMTMLTGHVDESKDEIRIDITGDFIETCEIFSPESRHSSVYSIPYQVGDICQQDSFVICIVYDCYDTDYYRVSHPAGMVVDTYNIAVHNSHRYLNVDGKDKLITMSIIPFLSEFKAWWPMLKPSNKKG